MYFTKPEEVAEFATNLKLKVGILIDTEIRELSEQDYQKRMREGRLTEAEQEFLYEGSEE